MIACYLGFITQAITANFAPLLFLTLHKDQILHLQSVCCPLNHFDLSSDVSDFTWKDSFYFNGIFLYAAAY